MPSRILLLSADFGSGHLTAARAIATLCAELEPGCDTEVLQVRSPVLNLVSRIYLWLIEHIPSLYRRLYCLQVGWLFRSLLLAVLGRTVRREIRRVRPDIIVSTHPFPGGVAAHLRLQGECSAPVLMALTDFRPHGFWIWDGVERYCVSSQAAAESLARMGVGRERIAVTGVAVRPEFAAAAAARNLKPAVTTRSVLVMGGGLGLGPIELAMRSLADLPHPDLRVTVICGSNQVLHQQMRALFAGDPRIAVVGFTSQVEEYMADADLLVTKPGGITCSEAMAMGLPMLLLQPLPGHEEENAAYLVATGSAVVTRSAGVGSAAAALLFEHPERLAAMRQRACRHGQPHAARAIARQALSLPAAPNA